jgi:2'-5' RNA ligase
MKILINLKIPKSVIQKLDNYKKEYFPAGFHKIGSHITIKAPFDLAGDFQEFVKSLSSLIANFSPLGLNLEGLGIFHEKILYFKFDKPDELIKLHSVVDKEVDENFKRNGTSKERDESEFNPHSTISISSPERIQKYKDEIEPNFPKLKFLIDGLALYVWRRDHWRLEKEITFGGV